MKSRITDPTHYVLLVSLIALAVLAGLSAWGGRLVSTLSGLLGWS